MQTNNVLEVIQISQKSKLQKYKEFKNESFVS